MRNTWVRDTLGWSMVFIAGALPCAARQSAAIDSLIAKEMAEKHMPGLVVAAIDSGQVVWIGTYGQADIATGRPATDSTPFQIASVSKIITATVLMTLHASGRFKLDDDINGHLPFQVRNPSFPETAITFRQLLIHRSSIADNQEYFRPYWSKADGDVTIPLGTFLREYLTPEGTHYSAERNFLPTAPGETSAYCNVCYALIAYLAQQISGIEFAKLSKQILFDPLGMAETGWFLTDLPSNRPATPYRFAADTGFVAYGQNGYPDWPAGMLRTSIRDLARFLVMYVGAGEIEGRAIVPAKVIEVMAPTDQHLGFLTWFLGATRSREITYTHAGGDLGVRTYMGFLHRGKRGVIVLSNGEAGVERIADEVFTQMAELGRTGRHR